MKSVLLIVCLAIFATAGAPVIAANSSDVKPKDSVKISKVISDTLTTKPSSMHQLVVYYFHGTQRCSNCIKIEAYTREVVDSSFSTQLKDSTIVWRLINTDEDVNKHFRDDYQLFTKSVVLSDLADGKQVRWKNLDKIWEYLGDKAAFQTYIRDEVTAYLKAK